jgi:Domain of unknown function (DUF4167)
MNGHRKVARGQLGGRPAYRAAPQARSGHPSMPNVRRNISGDARRKYDTYVALAREARSRGDLVEMENCYQHAEHYFRVLREQGR